MLAYRAHKRGCIRQARCDFDESECGGRDKTERNEGYVGGAGSVQTSAGARTHAMLVGASASRMKC